jgi:hypothetical protein
MRKDSYLKTFFYLSKIILLTTLISSPAHAIVFQSPIIVDDAYIKKNGNVIIGNFQGTSTQPAITVATKAPVVITNSVLQGPYDLIQDMTTPANITVTNTVGTGTNPNVRNVQKGIFLRVNTFANINMQNNNINGMRIGFFCNSYAGNKTASNTLVIDKNVFNNIDARPSDGKGSYLTTGQYNGQAIHTGNIFGLPGIDIGWNEILNVANQSSTGSLIELNETSGTAASPIQVHNNFISGAFPTKPGTDLYGFGGILVNGAASDTAKNASAFINIANNQVVATANYGIGIVAGHDVTVTQNRVVSSGFLPNGKTFYPMSTYGDAAGAINVNVFNQPAAVFFNNNVTTNVLGLIKNDGTNKPIRSDWNLPGQGGAVEGNVDFQPNDPSDPQTANEIQEFNNFQTALLLNHVTVGTITDAGYVPDGLPLTPSGPVNVTVSTPYVLDHVIISNPTGTCVSANGNSNATITITNSVIGPCGGDGIIASGAGAVIIQNNYIHDVVNHGVQVAVAFNQTVRQNTIENSGFGISIQSNNQVTTRANVDFNKLTNVMGISGQNVSAIQFNQVSGPNSSINCNVYTQTTPPVVPLAGTGDSFNLFLSSGTSASPIQVVGNRIQGGGAIWNGGGILLSDGDSGAGSSGPGFVVADDNLVMNPGGYGIDVSTGHDITINGNYVYGDAQNEYFQATSSYGPGRIGINTFNVYSSACFNITVTNNFAFYVSSLNGSVANYGLDTDACNPTFQNNNTGYNIGDSFQFPSFYTQRPSCAKLNKVIRH